MSKTKRLILVASIMLLAAVLRLWNLGGAPPGLSHDEVINGLVARDILAGHQAIYFTSAGLGQGAPLTTGGHEPLYHYVQAAAVGLFGENWVGLRWPSLAFGLLTVAIVYTLARHLFSFPTAVLTAAWLSVSFWPLFYTRVGLRAISLPFSAALSAYFFLQALDPGSENWSNGLRPSILSGFFLGISLYTYMAARILPLILAASLLYLLLITKKSTLPWLPVICIVLVAAVVAAPILVWLGTHPSAEERIFEVREPLDRLLEGDPTLVWRNLIANLGFFTFVGDPWFHQGLPGRPVFADPISAALFLAGVLVAVLRWREPRYGFLLIWLVGAIVPSVLSSHAPPELVSDAPSSIRDILAVVVAFIFPAVAVTEARRWIERRERVHQFLSRTPVIISAVSFLLLPCVGYTVRDYFGRWSQRSDVRFLYQADLTSVGHRLDELISRTSVTVAGLSVRTLDRPTLEFTARTQVDKVRLCDPRETLVIPAGRTSRVLVPNVIPFDDSNDLETRLADWTRVDRRDAFVTYAVEDRGRLDQHLSRIESRAQRPNGTPASLPVSFGGRLILLGYEWAQDPARHGGTSVLLTYWRVESPPTTPIKIFAHVVDQQGQLISQEDGLGSPPQGWSPGDLIVQRHALDFSERTNPGDCTTRVGVYYDTPEGERLDVLTGDYLLLYSPEG